MKKFYYNLIKYFLFNNFLYKLYLKRRINVNFDGIEDFNPIVLKKESLQKLMSINSHFFSKNDEINIPLKMHSFDW